MDTSQLRVFNDFTIEDSEVGPTVVCQVCDWWDHAEDLTLAELLEFAEQHTHIKKRSN